MFNSSEKEVESKNKKETEIQKNGKSLLDNVQKNTLKRFKRGAPVSTKGIQDKKIYDMLKKSENQITQGAIDSMNWNVLNIEEKGYLEAEDFEKTYQFSQKEIFENVDQQTQSKKIDLNLDHFGPYRVNFTTNGRYMLISGTKGHVAAFDWRKGSVKCELHLKETVRDITWLHNENLFAVAQKKYVYIYDSTGLEIHVLRKHSIPQRLSFLPYHFLLVSVGNTGFLKYQDVSTGEIICEHRTKLGSCRVMRSNPYNAVMCLGHQAGTVTMWTPNFSSPIVKMLCHSGPVTALAIDNRGHYLTTSGFDGKLKIWDIRTYKLLREYYTPKPASYLDVSQTGLLGVSYNSRVQIWKDAFLEKNSPYLSELFPSSPIQNIQFIPFEDFLGVGHTKGVSTMIVPGSGEVNFDSFEVNPYQNKKQRQEREIKALLEKIPADLITNDPHSISFIKRDQTEVLEELRKKSFKANNVKGSHNSKKKHRKNSSKENLKEQNIIDFKKACLIEKKEKKKRNQGKKSESSILDRFK